MRLIHADAIVTGDGPSLKDAAVVLRADESVEQVGPAAEVVAGAKGLRLERVRGVLVPGLINAHTHLELSAMAGKVRGGRGFLPWVDDLLGVRAEIEDEEVAAGIDAALSALDAAGTVAVGEVTNTLGAVPALAKAGLAGCVFHEVFGMVRASVLARVAGLARDFEERLGTWPSTELSYAPTPHTLSTTHPDAVRGLLAISRRRGARASLHLLEHDGERRAIEQGDGPAAEWMARRLPGFEEVVWPKMPVLDHAAALDALAPDVILVHLTIASAPELERIAQSGAPVVCCPRSNRTIEGKTPPLPAMFAAGLEPALGTDSLASSPSLDVLEEARALAAAFPEVAASRFLRMLTWNGAQTLGRPDLGRVARGARPGIVLFEGELGEADPAAFVLSHRGPRRFLARRGRPT